MALLEDPGQHHDQLDLALQYPADDVRDEKREVVLDLCGTLFV
jgi:hypothetical protein